MGNRRFIVFAALCAAAAPAAAVERIVDLYSSHDDMACSANLRSGPSVTHAVLAGCWFEPDGRFHEYGLYEWANEKFVPVPWTNLGSPTLMMPSIDAEARRGVTGPFAMGPDNTIRLYDITATTELATWNGILPRLTADGSAVIYGDPRNRRIARYDVASGTHSTITTIAHHLANISADGSVAIVHQAPTGYALVDTVAASTEILCTSPYDPTCFLGLSPDGRWLAYRRTLPDGSRERRLRDRVSGEEWTLPDADDTSFEPLHVVFDQGSRRMLFAQPHLDCGYSLFVRDLATFQDRPVAVESDCPARGRPTAFGVGDRIAISGNHVTTLDVLFVNGGESGTVDYFAY